MRLMKLRGAIPVLATPFHDDETIDEQDLRRQVDFAIAAGAAQFVFRVSAGSGTSFLIRSAIE